MAMASSSQPYLHSTAQAGGPGECRHPGHSPGCFQGSGTLLPPCPGSSSDVLCHCFTEYCKCCVFLLASALQDALLCSESTYSLERNKENATWQSDIFLLTPFQFLGSFLCFQTHKCWSNLQSCLGFALPLTSLVHGFLLLWSSCSCWCLAS